MSLDLVDDLHAAEERIGLLEACLREVLGWLHNGRPAGAAAALADTYCRPSCADHDHDDCDDEEALDCGCPAHPSMEPATVPLSADPDAPLPPSMLEELAAAGPRVDEPAMRTCQVVTCDVTSPVGADNQALCPPHRREYDEWKRGTDGF